MPSNGFTQLVEFCFSLSRINIKKGEIFLYTVKYHQDSEESTHLSHFQIAKIPYTSIQGALDIAYVGLHWCSPV